MAVEMGLPPEPVVLPEWRRRGYITVLRRNWHLLPYPQMLELLEMTRDQLAFSLMEDDFLWVKLGRIGYESSNHYFYTVPDIIEKVLSCRAVLDSVKTSE